MDNWKGQYMVGKSVHLWTGFDTVCRMWSTGGLGKVKGRIVQNDRFDANWKICNNCLNKLKTAKQIDAPNKQRDDSWNLLPSNEEAKFRVVIEPNGVVRTIGRSYKPYVQKREEGSDD